MFFTLSQRKLIELTKFSKEVEAHDAHFLLNELDWRGQSPTLPIFLTQLAFYNIGASARNVIIITHTMWIMKWDA